MSATAVPPIRMNWMNRYGGIRYDEGDWGLAILNYPTSNLAIYFPIYLDHPITLTQFWYANGAGTTGNVDMGIYNGDTLAKIITKGSTARGAAGTAPTLDVSDTFLGVGRYYLAFAQDTSAASSSANHSSSIANVIGREAGIFEQASAFPLPATMTPVAFSGTVVPFCGFDTSWTP